MHGHYRNIFRQLLHAVLTSTGLVSFSCSQVPADTVSHRPDGQISALWSRARPPDYKDTLSLEQVTELTCSSESHEPDQGLPFPHIITRPKENGLSVTGNHGSSHDVTSFIRSANAKLLTDRLQVCCSVRYAYTENRRRLRPSST